ncbi:hypothetical protein RhiJN_03506 [Ceratobasidium sp. AG-Ba]|nr:hypothetical protein RhiJN_03506 [Ceratobasidium sp. AG-Ba]
MPPKRKASTNPPNTSEPTATDPPKAKRTRSSKAAQPTADASTDSAKPRRKRNPTTSLKIATRGATKSEGKPVTKTSRKNESKSAQGVDKGSEAKTQVEAPAAKKPQNRNRKAAAPPKDEGWGNEPSIYQTMAEDEDEELSEDSEVENAPSVPTTSLPITLRLRVPSPKRSYFTHPSANSMHDLIEKCVSVSDSDFEIEPLPPKVKLPKDLRALGTTSRIVQVVESDEDEDSGDDDEDIGVGDLKVAIEQDGATETIVVSFAVDWPVFRCHVASKLGALLDNMRIAYRIADMAKSERNHLRNESHFEEMIKRALEWVNTKMDEIREAREAVWGGKKRKGKARAKSKEPAALQKLRAQLKGPIVTIIDLGEKKVKGKQNGKIKAVESPAVKFLRCEAEIRNRCCNICGSSCAIIHVPGKGPDHRPLTEEVIQLWANLASKGRASTIGDPPGQVLTRMSDARFATNSGRYTRLKDKAPSDSQPTTPAKPPAPLPSADTSLAPVPTPAPPVASNQHACMGMSMPHFSHSCSSMPPFPMPMCSHGMSYGHSIPPQHYFPHAHHHPGFSAGGMSTWGCSAPPNMPAHACSHSPHPHPPLSNPSNHP